MPAPAQDAQTPILAAFEGIEPTFGDPNEGEAVVLITDDVVVYKLTGGQPAIHEYEDSSNPLGPLQESAGPVLLR